MSEEIMEKLNEYSKEFKHVNERFDQLGEQVDLIAQKVLEHDRKFQEHDSQLDNIARTVADHTERLGRIEERLEQTSTKEDISKLVSTFDEMVGLYKKKDQELVFMGEHVKHVEEKVEKNTEDIMRIKPLAGLT